MLFSAILLYCLATPPQNLYLNPLTELLEQVVDGAAELGSGLIQVAADIYELEGQIEDYALDELERVTGSEDLRNLAEFGLMLRPSIRKTAKRGASTRSKPKTDSKSSTKSASKPAAARLAQRPSDALSRGRHGRSVRAVAHAKGRGYKILAYNVRAYIDGVKTFCDLIVQKPLITCIRLKDETASRPPGFERDGTKNAAFFGSVAGDANLPLDRDVSVRTEVWCCEEHEQCHGVAKAEVSVPKPRPSKPPRDRELHILGDEKSEPTIRPARPPRESGLQEADSPVPKPRPSKPPRDRGLDTLGDERSEPTIQPARPPRESGVNPGGKFP